MKHTFSFLLLSYSNEKELKGAMRRKGVGKPAEHGWPSRSKATDLRPVGEIRVGSNPTSCIRSNHDLNDSRAYSSGKEVPLKTEWRKSAQVRILQHAPAPII
jgi:hypothetical protein